MTGRRWVYAALVLYALGVGFVLLSPDSPSAQVDAVTAFVRERLGLRGVRQGWVEFGGNVVMFLPLGFLSALLFRVPWWGVVLAVALSVSAELVQVLLPARTATPRDVLANALGALLGAGLAWLVIIRRDPPRRRRATRRAR